MTITPFRVLLVVPLLLLCILTGSSFAGVLFTSQMSKARGGTSTYKAWSDGKSFKALVETSTDDDISAGNFVISRDGGTTYIAASARWKRYLVLGPEQLRERLGMRTQQLTGRVENLQVQRLNSVDGGMVAGYRTRRHTLRVSLVLRSRRFWRDVTSRMVITESLWMAEALPNFCPELPVLTRETIGPDEIDGALEFKDVKGFPMKRVVSVEVDGRSLGSSVFEVKTLTQTPLEESVFAIPPSYKKR
jgi:hypothetical protein